MNKKLFYVLMSLLSATAIYGMCTDHTEVTLACGIFGQINKHKQGKFNFPAFTTLGIANDSRGGDSCGIFIDGKTEYGIEKTKLFANFINSSQLLKTTTKCHIALGHCRKASVGAVDLKRAQPVVITNEHGEVEYVVMHNGTIHNYITLAHKYIPDVDIKEMSDSQVMAHIFYHCGFDVLSEYNGGAVFVIVDYRFNEPIVYAFKGSSRYYSTSQINTEERPFYFTISNNSFYFSSIYTWLQPFTKDTIYTIPENTVIRIQDNETYVEKEIDRSKCVQTAYTNYNHSNYNHTSYAYGYQYINNNKQIKILPTISGLYRYENGDYVHGSMYVNINGEIGYSFKNAKYLTFWHGRLLKNRSCATFLENFCQKGNIDPKDLDFIIPQTLNVLDFHPSCIATDGEYMYYDCSNADNIQPFTGSVQYFGDNIIYIVEDGCVADCVMPTNTEILDKLYTDNLLFKIDANMLNTLIIKECEINEKQ